MIDEATRTALREVFGDDSDGEDIEHAINLAIQGLKHVKAWLSPSQQVDILSLPSIPPSERPEVFLRSLKVHTCACLHRKFTFRWEASDGRLQHGLLNVDKTLAVSQGMA